MEIKIYYTDNGSLPQDGDLGNFLVTVLPLYSSTHANMERMKDGDIPLYMLANCVETIVASLDDASIYAQSKINAIWESLRPLREGETSPNAASQDFRCKRHYEETLIFAGVYYVLNSRATKNYDLLEAIKQKAAYDENTKPYFDFVINRATAKKDETEDPKRIEANNKMTAFMKETNGMNDEVKLKAYQRKIEEEQASEVPNNYFLSMLCTHAEVISKRLTREELNTNHAHQTTTNQTKELDVYTIEKILAVLKENAPEILNRVSELIIYLAYRHGTVTEQVKAICNQYSTESSKQEQTPINSSNPLKPNGKPALEMRIRNNYKLKIVQFAHLIAQYGWLMASEPNQNLSIADVNAWFGKIFNYDFEAQSGRLSTLYTSGNYKGLGDDINKLLEQEHKSRLNS